MASSDSMNERCQMRAARLEAIGKALAANREKTTTFMRKQQRLLVEIEGRFRREFEVISSRMADWDDFQNSFAGRFEAFQEQRQRLEQDRTTLEARAAELATLRTNTEVQRGRLAKKFDDRKRKLMAEELALQSGQDEQLTAARNALNRTESELERLQHEREDLRDREEDSRRQVTDLELQLSATQLELNHSRSDISKLEQSIQELHSQLETLGQKTSADHRASLDALRKERDELQTRIQELHEQLEEETGRQRDSDARTSELESLRKLYESAVESAAYLQDKNDQLLQELSDLQSQLSEQTAASTHSSRSSAGIDDPGPSDWESQKRRLLANLDNNDFDRDDQVRVEEIVRRTDALIAEKDRRLVELSQLLDDIQAEEKVVATSTTSAHHYEILDADAVICQEREKLAKLQQEWQDKLRGAEVECAQERAQNARLRSELERKLRDLEHEIGQMQPQDAPKSKRGRKWLDHLGLGPTSEK